MRRPVPVVLAFGLLFLCVLGCASLAWSRASAPVLAQGGAPAPVPTEVPPSPAPATPGPGPATPSPRPATPGPGPGPATPGPGPAVTVPARPMRLALVQSPLDPVANAWYVGVEQGIFKKHGLDLHLLDCPSWGAAVRAISQGQADGCVVGPHWPLFASYCGFPARIVLVTQNAIDDCLIARGGIRSIKGLAHKRVGTRGGASASAFLAELLRRHGMSLKSIRFMPSTTMDDVVLGWRTGNLDAIVAWEPVLSQARRKYRPVTLARSGSVPGVAPGFVVMTPDAIAGRPQEIQKMVDTWYDIVDWIRAHPQEADAIVARHADLPVAKYNFRLYGVRLMGRDENPAAFTPRDDFRDFTSLWNLVPYRLILDRQTTRSEGNTRPANIEVDPRFVAPQVTIPTRPVDPAPEESPAPAESPAPR